MDLIGNIHHSFILDATDYFTKWTEAIPLKEAEHKDVIQFIKEHIIHRFRIPAFINTNQGTMFTGKKMNYFVVDYGIQLIRLTPFNAHVTPQIPAQPVWRIRTKFRDARPYTGTLYLIFLFF